MSLLQTYLDKLIERGNSKLAESVKQTAEEVSSKHIQTFSFVEHEVGLLFGNVQSGKTGQMFGIMCRAADLGFPAFLLLTTDNVVLQQQTLERVQEDLEGFCICGENDSKLFMENQLVKPVIVVLKKNARILRLWANIFNNTQFMKGNPLFIVDDEADAASLNTMINSNKQSSINKNLDIIKNGASSSIYLQVTGTPQALFLQSIISGWQPAFTYYFKPGSGYLGGNFFFAQPVKENVVSFIDDEKISILNMLIHHLAVSAIVLSSKKVCNCIIHPGVRQASHEALALKVEKALQWCKDNLDNNFAEKLKAEYESLAPKKYEKPAFAEAFKFVKELLTEDRTKILIMNGKNDVSTGDYAEGCNIVVGGNTLGRGVTFPALHTIYYTRSSKKPQADTMWQHSRMFGYDRDAGLVRLYIDSLLFKLFADINAANNSIINQIDAGVTSLKVYYPKNINPTRKNVLDKKLVGAIVGGANYYPFAPGNDSIEAIDKLMQPFDDKERYYQVNLRMMLQVLAHITSEDDFDIEAFKEFIEAIITETPTAQGILIVRRERDIAKGTGAMLSPNDWKLGGQFKDKIVITMYKVTGNKGWNGQKLWIPNIKLPEGKVYYDVKG